MMSRHVNPQRSDRTSKASYNFVPLPEAVFLAPAAQQEIPPWKRFDEYIPDTHTGWIELTLTTETPLYVRCGPKLEDLQHEDAGADHAALTRKHRHRQDFFHHGDPSHPVIPGSSVRGMSRNVFEILASAKMHHTKSRRLYFRSLGKDAMAVLYRKRFATNAQLGRRCGLFRRTETGGEIVPCDFARVLESALKKLGRGDVREGKSANSLPNWALQHQRVFVEFTPGKREPQVTKIRLVSYENEKPQGQEKEGILVITGWGNSKKREFVFFPAKEPVFEVAADVVKDFEDDDQLSAWQQDAFPKNKPRDGARRRAGLLQDKEPVFFLQGKGQEVLVLGRAGMFRLPYKYRTEDMIPEVLRRPGDIDLAMAVFGTVDEKDQRSGFGGQVIKGRVFFEDLYWNGQGSPFLPDKKGLRSPKILSSPKPTAFQHYLIQDNPDNARDLFHYDSSPEETRIRGYKRYWHKRGADPFEAKLVDDTQHTVVRPVAAGTVFAGRVRFENLSDLELGALLSALQLPETKQHHLGMGKSLGMGSVHVKAQLQLTARTPSNGPSDHDRYACMFQDDRTLHLGLLPEADIRQIEDRAKEIFRTAMVKHHNASAPKPLPEDADIWTIPRLSALSVMLEWDQRPDLDKTSYLPLGNEWRSRTVLPTPHKVIGAQEPDWGEPSQKRRRPVRQAESSSRSQRSDPQQKRGGRSERQEKAPVVSGRPVMPKSGTTVTCIILEEKTKKDKWKAKLKDGQGIGVILSNNEPSDITPGQEVELTVVSTDPKNMSFSWPKPTE